jgi:hypothetical protein
LRWPAHGAGAPVSSSLFRRKLPLPTQNAQGLPPPDEILKALKLPPLKNITHVLLGQSVNGTKLPGSPDLPPIEDVVKAVNTAGHVLTKVPLNKVPSRLPTAGEMATAVASVGARAAAQRRAKVARRRGGAA